MRSVKQKGYRPILASEKMKIATWNINSIRIRLDSIAMFVEEEEPDYICLQELKCQEQQFPYEEIEALGYTALVYGQKSYNGVAILSKTRPEEVQKGIPCYEDSSARYLEMLCVNNNTAMRLVSLYAPNGNPRPSEKFSYKLHWYKNFLEHVKKLQQYEEIIILAGDYNIIPRACDIYDPKAWWGDALYCPETIEFYRLITKMGYADAFMLMDGCEHQYSMWEYQKGAFAKNNGMRIDHFFLNARAVDRIETMYFYKKARGWEKPSDHIPVVLKLKDI